MKEFFENIKKESQQKITKMINKDVGRSNNQERKFIVLKQYKTSFQIANIASAIVFTLCFLLIGWFVNFLIERDSFSLLYQIILFGVSLVFLKISFYFFLSYSYILSKINQLISQFQINKN